MRRVLGAVVLVAAAVLAVASPAHAEDPVSAGASQGIATPGDQITVYGAGWPAGSHVQASLCGNQALNGSVDCDLASSRTVITDEAGKFQMPMEVAAPPEPCPCVLFFVSPATTATVRFPVEVVGAPIAPSAHSGPRTTPAVKVLSAKVTGAGPWSSWFGAGPNRELVLTLENTSIEPTVPQLDVSWGKGSDPKRVLALPALEEIPGGAKRTVRLPFTLDALSLGGYTIAGEVTGPGGPTPFTASTHTYPWGWIVLVLVLLQIWLIRRWRRRRPEPAEGESPSADDGTTIDVDELDPSHLDAAPADPVSAYASSPGAALPDGSDGFHKLGAAMAGLAVAAARLRDCRPLPVPWAAATSPTVIDLRAPAPAVARRPERVAIQLAEALADRAAAQSALLLATAEQDRAQAAEVLESAEDAHTQAEMTLAVAEERAREIEAAARARAERLEQNAQRRAEQLEVDAQRRAAAAGRDPVGQAIRRAVSSALDTP